jgi:hypothetical protein
MASKTAFFNKFLCASPEYTNVKDYNNVIKHIIVLKLPNTHIKVKFAKYKLMENKTPFYKAQRLLLVLHKFVQYCKARRIKEYNNNLDLYGTLIENPFTLIENKTAYKFSLTDLQKVIINALLNQRYIMPEPMQPKNPYTNLPFSKHNLLLIYCLTPKKHTLFTLFYKCDFDINAFRNYSYKLLLEYAINDYTRECSIDDIYCMCEEYHIRLSEDFPEDVLCSVFRPYLKEFYRNQIVRTTTLERLFFCFDLYNPHFGMKYVDSTGTINFDTRHLEFNQVTAMFNSSNLKYAIENKYKDNELCITLKPLPGVTYLIEEYESDYEECGSDSDS